MALPAFFEDQIMEDNQTPSHLHAGPLGEIINTGNGLFSVFHHFLFPNLLCNLLCLAISKHIFIMSFYSIQITICLFH